jgi:hypothetical protein
MPTTQADIFTEARAAAQVAALLKNASLPPEQHRGLDCGFAWVNIKPARGPFVTYLKSIKVGETGERGYQIWYSCLHDLPTQSVAVHEAAAQAFALTLGKYNIRATWSSRLD